MDVGDRCLLVLGLLIGKAGAEFVVEAGFGGSTGGSDRAIRRSAAMRISSAAISRTRSFIRALRVCQPAPPSRSSSTPSLGAVAGQKLDILDRQEQLAAVIVDLEAIVRRAGGLDGVQPDIAADAMIDMGDEIARREARRLGDEILRPLRLRGAGEPGGRRECPLR